MDEQVLAKFSSVNMQTEQACLKQPKVLRRLKKTRKGKKPGKDGKLSSGINALTLGINALGLGVKAPREAVQGTYIKKQRPFTGACILSGTCRRFSAKMMNTIVVRRDYLYFVKEDQRYERIHSNVRAHLSPCLRVKEGDGVIIGQCRPFTNPVPVHYNVLKVLPVT